MPMAKKRLELTAVSMRGRSSIDKPQREVLSRMQANASRAKPRSSIAMPNVKSSESPALIQTPGDAQWPLSATNEASKFRALKVFDRRITAGDGEVSSSEELSEVLGRPDQVQLALRFANVVGTPQVTLRTLTSFDGVHETALGYDVFSIAGNATHDFTLFLPPSVRLRYSLSLDSGSAEVRGYARSVMPGRRRFGTLVLDKVLEGTSAYYSEAKFHDMLGAVDKLTYLFLADQIAGTSPTVQIAVEESPDGITWDTVMFFNFAPISSLNGLYTDLDASVPRSKLARFRITLGGTNPSANIQVYAFGRGQ